MGTGTFVLHVNIADNVHKSKEQFRMNNVTVNTMNVPLKNVYLRSITARWYILNNSCHVKVCVCVRVGGLVGGW